MLENEFVRLGEPRKLKTEFRERTKQSYKDEVDINTIVKRFGLTGEVPVGVRMPLQADFVQAVTFQDAMNAIVAARESFDQMQSHVRKRFHNDPAEFVAFMEDEKNAEEAVKLGIRLPPDRQAKLDQARLEAEAERQVKLEAAIAAKRPPAAPKAP